MSRLQEFFKGEDTHLGIFYPTGHMLAIFPDMPSAQSAIQRVESMGFKEDEVLTVPGADVKALAEELKADEGLGAMISKQLSRATNTDQAYFDRDLEMANEGKAFLVVRCADEDRKKAAWSVIKPLNTLVARYYAKGGMEHFAGDSLGLKHVVGHPDSPGTPVG